MLALLLALCMMPASLQAQTRQPTPPPIVRTAPPPVITPTASRTQRFGYWNASDLGNYTEAWTGNESGSTFGIVCGKSCLFYVDFQTACDHGDSYPAMVNSDAGAWSITLKCHVLDSRYVLSTDATDGYIEILKDGGEIGFAIPLKSGRFNVSRFSLQGGFDAVSHAIDAAVKKGEQSQQGLRDFTI